LAGECRLVQDIQVDVVAVLNDTTGTLLAGSYLDKHCGIGLIMGILLIAFPWCLLTLTGYWHVSS